MRLPQHQPIYDERMVVPMRQELTRIGFEELRSPEQVDAKLKDAPGTTLVVVNSICGCAARNARSTLAASNSCRWRRYKPRRRSR